MLPRLSTAAHRIAQLYTRTKNRMPAAARGLAAAALAVAVAFGGATVTTVATADRAEAAYYLYKKCHNNGIRLRVRFLVGEYQTRTVVYDALARARYRYKTQNPDFFEKWAGGVHHKAGRGTRKVDGLWQQKARFRDNITLQPGGTLRVTALKRSGGGCSVTRTAPR